MKVQPHKLIISSQRYEKQKIGEPVELIQFSAAADQEETYTTGVFVDSGGFLTELPISLLKVVDNEKE